VPVGKVERLLKTNINGTFLRLPPLYVDLDASFHNRRGAFGASFLGPAHRQYPVFDVSKSKMSSIVPVRKVAKGGGYKEVVNKLAAQRVDKGLFWRAMSLAAGESNFLAVIGENSERVKDYLVGIENRTNKNPWPMWAGGHGFGPEWSWNSRRSYKYLAKAILGKDKKKIDFMTRRLGEVLCRSFNNHLFLQEGSSSSSSNTSDDKKHIWRSVSNWLLRGNNVTEENYQIQYRLTNIGMSTVKFPPVGNATKDGKPLITVRSWYWCYSYYKGRDWFSYKS